MSHDVAISTAMSDDELRLSRIHDAFHRSGLDASTLLEMVASWVEDEFAGDDVSDEMARRFRQRIEAPWPEGAGITPAARLTQVISESDRFRHRNEQSDAELAERLKVMRARVAQLSPGTAREKGSHGSYGNTTSPDPNAADGIKRRLNRHRPDLAAKVATGEMSANAAAIEAGMRRRKVQVPYEDAEATARTLRRRMSPEALARLRELL